MRSFVCFWQIVVLSLLAACGGGGGGGDGSGNSIAVSPGSVALVSGSGSNDVASKTVQVTFHGAGVVIGIPPGGSLPSWLSVTPGTGTTTSVPVTISALANTLGPGRYPVTLRFVTGNADQSGLVWQDVDVSLTVAPKATPTALQLDGVAQGPKVGASIALVVGGSWTARVSDPWLSLDKSSGSSSTSIAVSADPAALAAGSYSGSVSIEDTATHVVTVVPVSFGVDPQRLLVRQRGVALALFGSKSRLTSTITVSANGKAATQWSASSDQPWLQLSAAEGSTDSALTLSADATGLADGMHYARVTIAPKNEPAVASSVVVRVGLYVSRGSVFVANVSGDARVPSPYPSVQAFDFVPDPIRPYFYHSQADATIDIHNSYTGAIVGSVTIPNAKLGAMATSLDGSRLFVVDVAGAKIYPVDLDTLAVGAPIDNARIVTNLSGIAWTEVNGQQVIITGGRQVFDANTGGLLADAWNSAGFITQTQRIAAQRDGRAVFFQDGSGANHDLSRYSLSSRGGVLRFERTHRINETGDGDGIALDAADTRVYTAARGGQQLDGRPTAGFGYDAATLTQLGALGTSLTWASGVATSPSGAIYASNWIDSRVSTFTSGFVETANYSFGEHTDRIALSGDGHRLGMYVQSSMKRVLHFTDVP